MEVFTIKDIENLSGIKAHTIRIWEQRYSFLAPQRTETNIRYYSNRELQMLLNVALLNKYGYKISRIARMSEEDIKTKIYALSHGQAHQERTIHDMIQHMTLLQTEELEKLLDEYITTKGIEKAITQIIFPFLERIGILWLTNRINPAQEHMVSNIIRQKFIMGIESAYAVSSLHQTKTVLLFLPEGEYHELGLLFIYYLFKSRGVKVLYLGANIPLRDVEYVAKLKTPDLIHSHLTSIPGNFNFEKFLARMSQSFPDTQVMISGPLTQNYSKKIPDNICFKQSLAEVVAYISMLS